jgi:predicted RNA-binding Zn-ribbon protein involved in translation (DUF1610 family)
MRINDIGIDNAQELLDLVGSALDLGPEVLEHITQAEPHYFSDARQELLKALSRWDDDHTVPACLSCGSERVDWVDALAMYRCQDCGAQEERTSRTRKAA